MPMLTTIKHRAGRKPRASLRRMTPAVFEFLTQHIFRMRAQALIKAARLHLVDGLPMVDAARQAGVPANSLENVRKIIAEKDDLLAPVYAPSAVRNNAGTDREDGVE